MSDTRMMPLTRAQREALFLVVALGCVEPGRWCCTSTEWPPCSDWIGDEHLTTLCDDLVALGLLHDAGGDFLALFCPTVAGVQRVIALLHTFLATLPPEVSTDV